MTDKNENLKLIRMNEVEATEIDWLWYPYIPFGKITVIQGDPGDGKTTVVLAIAAAVTTGAALPESKTAAEPMSVIFQTAEDGLGDTVKPRLVQSGADCGRVIVIDESEKELSLACTRGGTSGKVCCTAAARCRRCKSSIPAAPFGTASA